MFKVTIKPLGNRYIENGQPNPIQWYILKETEDGFINQTDAFKCKDFLNDVVYYLNTKQSFSIYEFDTSILKDISLEKPLPLYLTNLCPKFIDNINKVVNPWFKENGWPQLDVHKVEETTAILFLDPFYLKNTYNVSLVTLIVRLCNYQPFNSFKELKAYKYPYQDQALWDTALDNNIYFNLPDKVKEYIWYQGDGYNNKKMVHTDYRTTSYVHNCGFVAWSNCL